MNRPPPPDTHRFTLWSRTVLRHRVGPWELEATHREERCWELAAALVGDAADAECVVMPPGEKPEV